MYINMTPDKTNKTLHASQDDTTRQFKFKLVNDSQVLDTSDSIPPVIYDVEPNGIEQLLPVNSSTPTTSPIIADIQYPDELRENQEFVERITPTTLKGQAKIEKIKGNTLVFNQLVNVNVASNYINFDNGVISLTGTPTGRVDLMTNNIEHISNHKYLLISNTLANPNNVQFTLGMSNGTPWVTNVGTIGDHSQLYTNSYRTKLSFYDVENKDLTGIKMTCAIFDLTQMFGAGNEPTSVSDFTDLFPLPYYNYNAGSLLSFNGTGIKSIGFNQWDEEWELGTINGSGELQPSTTEIRTKNYIQVLPNTSYYVATPGVQVFHYYAGDYSYLGNQHVGNSMALNLPSQTRYVKFRCANTYGTVYKNDICVNISDSSKNGTYEPYKETTTSLPTSTYFPTGMKSAGSIYDELTESKAITRIGAVDLGTLTWTYDSANNRFKSNAISDILPPSSASVSANAVCGKYPVLSYNNSVATDKTMTVIFQGSAAVGQLWVHDSSFTSASAFASAMNGVYLYYELKTSTEEDIESCSLVSEDVEIPLEYDSGFLVCDSEGLTTKSGFIPCKIKQIKGDQTIYSQLINLHVERRP